MAQQLLAGQGYLIIKTSQSYSVTPHSVGLLCTCVQPDTETYTEQNSLHTHETDMHTSTGFELALPTVEWPQTHALDRTAAGIGYTSSIQKKNCKK
jgi:hypothetical protein